MTPLLRRNHGTINAPGIMIFLRRRLVSKLCAGLFVVLIALPFTAPFRAWDSGTPTGKTSSHDLKTSDEFSNSCAIASHTVSVIAASSSVIIRRRTAAALAPRPHTLQIVLRL